MKKTNNYPVVLVHGFTGYGDEDKLTEKCPYFGMTNGNAAKAIREQGIECHTPSVGPYSSAWDRACVLYAKLAGGIVDFGKVHSERYGHERYGRTYNAMVTNWGQLDNEGKIKKIHLIGHSFGGPTVRTLIHLLANGSEEERNATPENNLNPLFEGGRKDWVHSCTTLAATHNGVTLPDAGKPFVKPIERVLFSLGSVLSETPLRHSYDFYLERFGMSNPAGEKKPKFRLKSKNITRYMDLDRDNIFYEMSLKGGKEITNDFKTYDNIFYFSHAGDRTRRLGNTDVYIPTKKMCPIIMPFSILEGIYSNTKNKSKPIVGKSWRPNDGLVNVPSARAPINENQAEFSSLKECKPGVWYKMPIEDMDHLSYMGIGETEEHYNNYFLEIVDRITDLPLTD